LLRPGTAARAAAPASAFAAVHFRLAIEARTEIVDVPIAERPAGDFVVGELHTVVEVILHVRTSFGACLEGA
jgi:hypothetical protein